MQEDKIRNLEMIQNIINRMANNSFMLKGWVITIIAGIFSLNLDKISFAIYLLIYFIIILFWVLDAYYLQLERRYRALYEKCLDSNKTDFNLKLLPSSFENNTALIQVLLSKTELGFYLLLAVIISIVFIVI